MSRNLLLVATGCRSLGDGAGFVQASLVGTRFRWLSSLSHRVDLQQVYRCDGGQLLGADRSELSSISLYSVAV